MGKCFQISLGMRYGLIQFKIDTEAKQSNIKKLYVCEACTQL